MANDPATAAISGMSTIAGQLIGNAQSKKNLERQIQANKDMAEQQRKWALEDRSHAEAYNSPVMEKLRLMDAGLSPANFVGDTAASPDVAPVDLSHVNDPLSQMADISQSTGSVVGNSIASSVAVLKALSEVNRNNADSEESKVTAKRIEKTTDGIVTQLELQNDSISQDILTKSAQEKAFLSSSKLSDAERKEHEQNYEFLKDTFELRKYQMSLESVLTELNVDKAAWDVKVNLPLEAELKKASIQEKQAHVKEMFAMCANLAAQTDNFRSLTNLNVEQLKQAIVQTHILKSTEVDKILSEHESRRRLELQNKGEEFSNDKLEFETKAMLWDYIFKGISTASGAYRDFGVGTNQFAGAIGSMISGLKGLPSSANSALSPFDVFTTPNFSQ